MRRTPTICARSLPVLCAEFHLLAKFWPFSSRNTSPQHHPRKTFLRTRHPLSPPLQLLSICRRRVRAGGCAPSASVRAHVLGRHDHQAVGLGQQLGVQDHLRGALPLRHAGRSRSNAYPASTRHTTCRGAARHCPTRISTWPAPSAEAVRCYPPPPPPRTLSRWLAWCLQAVFNPKDPNTFASASLDRSIKVWGLTSPTPHFTLEGHDKGVNCIDYFAGRAPRPPRARSAPPLRGSVRAGERRLGC